VQGCVRLYFSNGDSIDETVDYGLLSSSVIVVQYFEPCASCLEDISPDPTRRELSKLILIWASYQNGHQPTYS